MKRLRVLNLILLVLAILATWRSVSVWRRGAPPIDAPVDAGAGKPVTAPLPAAPRKPQLPQLVSTVYEKDLFDQSRKKQDDVAPAPQSTPSAPPTLKLAGVILVGREREAVVVDTAQANKQIRLREGEEIQGYRVGKIGRDEISIVGGGGEEVSLALQVDRSKTAKKAFGPGGKPAPKAPNVAGGANAPPPPLPVAAAPPPAGAGSNPSVGPFPPGAAAAGGAENDPRKRAEAARERLRRLRNEAGAQ